MRNNKLHTPVGVRDILIEETAVKAEIIDRIENIFKCYGYNAVESPTFEYIEVFSDEKRGSTNPKDMYKFFDRDGATLALRSDMTPPIARIAATAYSNSSLPLRFSYFGNAFRLNGDYHGKLSEFSQAGVELMGINSVDADAEVISVAVNSLLSTGLNDFKIMIGHVGFFKGILEESGFDYETCEYLQNSIAKRDYVSVEKKVLESDIPENIKMLLVELPKLVGSLNILAYAKRQTKNREAKAAISKLQELYQVLKCYGMEDYICFDLGMVNKLNYYTGVIFRGYIHGTGYTVVDGGRYDNLVNQYGFDTPAVGFSLKISEIIRAVNYQNIDIPTKFAKTLFAFTEAGRFMAINTASRFRRAGNYAETSLIGDSIKDNMAYALEKNMTHVLYFIDDENMKVISIADEMGGFTVDMPISELIIPGEENCGQ